MVVKKIYNVHIIYENMYIMGERFCVLHCLRGGRTIFLNEYWGIWGVKW